MAKKDPFRVHRNEVALISGNSNDCLDFAAMITRFARYRLLKRRIKDTLVELAFERLGVHPGELNHPLALIKYMNEMTTGVIHVGANTGQEFESYLNADLASAVYIEPIPEIFEELEKRVSVDPRHHAIRALCTDKAGENVEFNIASNGGQSSSIFELGTSKDEHPDVQYVNKIRLQTSTLDDIIFNTPGIDREKLDCLVMDVQGAEMKVIKGASRTLEQCRFVFAEISEGGFYVGDSPVDAIIDSLSQFGFKLKAMGINRHHWGNAFFVK